MQHPNPALRERRIHLDIEAMALDAKFYLGLYAGEAHLLFQTAESPWFKHLCDELDELSRQMYAVDAARIDLNTQILSGVA